MLEFSDKRISLPCATLKEPLLDHVNCANLECCNRGIFHKTIHQDVRNSTSLPSHHNPMRTQSYVDDSSRSTNKGKVKANKEETRQNFCFFACPEEIMRISPFLSLCWENVLPFA